RHHVPAAALAMKGRVEPALAGLIEELWRERWGLPIVSVQREYQPADVEGLAWREGEEVSGLVTWAVDGDRAEIVSLDAFQPGRRIGARLMEAAEAELRRRGVRWLRVVTTNDNHRALGFYVRRGYRLVRLHLDAMDRVRERKPQVPATGNEGISLRDMWELEKVL
ncbi:MAG TPA: GNAT family N-acetyltransferase, partial [Dehalococcoidia bacterium]|nr:GNAT family N-acetyltransferase [Dehalococcoidia bacterium]